MQQITLTNDLTNYDKSRSLLNLMIYFWFVKAKAKIDKSSNTARKKKWAKLDPYEMNILIPVTTTGKYYLVDRPAGLLLAHAPVPFLTWARFFAWMKKLNPPGTPPNDAVKDIVENGTTLTRVNAALADDSTWSGSPTAWKTVDENKDDIILITGTPLSDDDIVKLIQEQVFQNFHFQSAVYRYNTSLGDGKPSYYTAALDLQDEAFSASTRNKTIYVVNTGQFKPDDNTSGEDEGEGTDTGDSDDSQNDDSADAGTGTSESGDSSASQDNQDTTEGASDESDATGQQDDQTPAS